MAKAHKHLHRLTRPSVTHVRCEMLSHLALPPKGSVCCTQLIGQALIFADTVSEIGAPPPHPPSCPASCPAEFAPWAPSTVQELYGDSPYELPTSP